MIDRSTNLYLYESLASYIVFKERQVIKSMNRTGVIDFTSSKAETTIQRTIDAMNEGELLYIRSGIYDLQLPISITKHIGITGETIYYDHHVVKGTVLTRSGNVININLTNNRHYMSPFISNIIIDGQDRSDDCMKLTDFHGTLRDIGLMYGNYGISMTDCWNTTCDNILSRFNNYGIGTNNPENNALKFFGCMFSNNRIMGAYLKGGVQIGFFGCNFESNGKYGVSIDDSTRVVSFNGCYFEKNPNYIDWAYSTSGAHVMLGETYAQPPVTAISMNGCYFGPQDSDVNIIEAPRIKIGYAYGTLISACLFHNTIPFRPDITNNSSTDANIVIMSSVQFGRDGWLIDGVWGMLGIKSINTKGLMTGPIEPTNNITSLDSPYFITPKDYTIKCDASLGEIKVILPTTVENKGRIYVIKKWDNSTNIITVLSYKSSQTIDGDSKRLLVIQYDILVVQSDGVNWMVIR